MELTACETEAEAGTNKTKVEPERLRTMVELDGRQSLVNLKGWKVEMMM